MSRKKRLIHYRRCHVCGGVTEQGDRIERCQHCGKAVVPFLYYDDTLQPGVSAEQHVYKQREGEWKPIIGLTAYW